jgi:starch phosphorylase
MSGEAKVAYFSMEIALSEEIPTYSGGLGVLAGDTIRSCADLNVKVVAITLLHRKGYFRQRLNERGGQSEEPETWPVDRFLEPQEARVTVDIEGRPVEIRCWRYLVRGVGGAEVPTYLLDTDLSGNTPEDRRLTDSLYAGDERHRLRQEVVLGIGGVKMLRALGHHHLDRYHLNEGHAALAILALLEERHGDPPRAHPELDARIEEIRKSCVFTTHTPVPAGHDKFPMDVARQVLGERRTRWLATVAEGNVLNMTDLALEGSHFVNGVAMRHGEVSKGLFPEYPIRSITNGIHSPTWAAPPFRDLFDCHIEEWRRDPLSLRYALGIPLEEIWQAHLRAKADLIQRIKRDTDESFDPDTLTIGFARRATAYKRATLVFSDIDRLTRIAKQAGPLQLVFAGKAHPRDAEGKKLIRQIYAARESLRGHVNVAYLPDYGMKLGRLLCAGSDVWLNTPIPPLEASGTSGMKAALNGVPSLSVLDGWWIEGCVEGVTGWAIGTDGGGGGHRHQTISNRRAANSLYDKLERAVVPCFYRDRERFLEIMRNAIALNASFFNTQRMVLQYLSDAYLEQPDARVTREGPGPGERAPSPASRLTRPA